MLKRKSSWLSAVKPESIFIGSPRTCSNIPALHTAILEEDEMAKFKRMLSEALKEAAGLRRENRKLDAEIARLRESTRKTIDRIDQELKYVQAAR
jgi:hypothetical protein